MELKSPGLEEIEAIHVKYAESIQEKLVAAAVKNNLLLCAGTDFHEFDQPGLNQIACETRLILNTGGRRYESI